MSHRGTNDCQDSCMTCNPSLHVLLHPAARRSPHLLEYLYDTCFGICFSPQVATAFRLCGTILYRLDIFQAELRRIMSDLCNKKEDDVPSSFFSMPEKAPSGLKEFFIYLVNSVPVKFYKVIRHQTTLIRHNGIGKYDKILLRYPIFMQCFLWNQNI